MLTLAIVGTLCILHDPSLTRHVLQMKVNVGMMRSKIVLFIATHVRTPCTLLTRQQLIVEPFHNGPKGIGKQPHEILFRVALALDSGKKLNEQCSSQSEAEASTI